MSTFFKALERAEQERALRNLARPPQSPGESASTAPTPIAPDPAGVGDAAAQGSVAPESASSQAPKSSFFKAPREGVARTGEYASECEEHLVSLLAPTSFEAEQYRALRHVIDQQRRSTELTVIAVSSPDAADGKTTTAINLAGALAQAADARVLLADADLRAASVATHLGLADHGIPGLVNAILDSSLTLDAVVQRCPQFNLSVLTAGRRPSSPYEVLKSMRIGEIFADARKKYDYVIVDTPPLVSIPDSRVISKWVDGFLIVVAAHRTPRRLLEEALNLIEPAKIVGMVFNGDDRHISRYSYASTRRPVFRDRSRRRQTASDD